ncbi:unnamed protein product [Polarella glacialis]|uniref:Uncharacterized protein n=1 Tax=Polarella glacialis TaxID=89957 RepID=A0A813FJC7_POLGL|nr:unnamed protein product [Polarella glacialis]
MTAGRTWEGLEEDIAYCETEGLTQEVSLAVWWVRQWMTATPSAMNSTLEEWSEFLWNVCSFELDLPTAASVLSPAFLADLAEQGVPFAIRRLELVSEGILEDAACHGCGKRSCSSYRRECQTNPVSLHGAEHDLNASRTTVARTTTWTPPRRSVAL